MHGQLVVLRAALIGALLCAASPRPGFAQAELTGSWVPVQAKDVSVAPDTLPVDFVALPLTDEGRTRALSYSESQFSMLERQCEGWPQTFLLEGAPFGLKIWNERDEATGSVVAHTIGPWIDRAPMVIWMDGRKHPSPYARRTRGGFTTGQWQGTVLVARTTHLKSGYHRRMGAPVSDEAAMTTYFFRNGDLLTVMTVVEDPLYLAEPYVMSATYQQSPNELEPSAPCMPVWEGFSPGANVPHYLPEENPFVDEVTKKYGIPREAVLGFPETIYPEYRQKMIAPARRSP